MNYIIIHFQKTKEGIVGKPSTFFLAAFCLMQWWSQHLRERYSLKPCPPDFSLPWQLTVMSILRWCQQLLTCKLGSVSRMGIFAKKDLPRSHLLWRPLGTFFTTIGTEVFSWGTRNQVTVLACACERQSEQFAQRKIGHIGFLRGYIFLSIERPNKALLENHQHSFLHLVAWCSDWANTSGNGTVWNYGHLTSV